MSVPLLVGAMLEFWRARKIAKAEVMGGPLAPQIEGVVYFKEVPGGTVVTVKVGGLPPYQPAQDDEDPVGPHGFHIHEFGDCRAGEPTDPFQAAGGHYSPDGNPHGDHAGDLPVLFSNDGRARMTIFTDEFNVEDIIGRSVIIHENPDDYRSQPAGDAGKRLACGVIDWM